MTLARLDGSELMIIDGADILDSNGRLGLSKMLQKFGVRALVSMTAKRDYAETVAVLFDSTLWVEGGIVIDIGLKDFKSRLAAHDFHYEMSDDTRV